MALKQAPPTGTVPRMAAAHTAGSAPKKLCWERNLSPQPSALMASRHDGERLRDPSARGAVKRHGGRRAAGRVARAPRNRERRPPGDSRRTFLVARRPARRTWSGAFVTGTNVASIEVRTNLFSIDVPRTCASAAFAFVLDVLTRRRSSCEAYRLRVIARNSAGREYGRRLPLEIR